MPRPLARVAAACCYLGAIRLPFLPLPYPDWLYTVPGGLVTAAALWLASRGRLPFLHHHARAGLLWAVQANGMLFLLALVGRFLYAAWFQTGIPLLNELWHLSAEIFRWSAVLVTLLTLAAMRKATRGQTGDPLGLPH